MRVTIPTLHDIQWIQWDDISKYPTKHTAHCKCQRNEFPSPHFSFSGLSVPSNREMVISCLNNLFYSIISSKSNVGFWQSRKDEIRMAWCQRPPGPNQDTESPKSEWRISEEKKTRLYRMFTRREQLGGGFLESIFLKQSFWVSRHGFWPQRPSRNTQRSQREVAWSSSGRSCSGFAGYQQAGFLPDFPYPPWHRPRPPA